MHAAGPLLGCCERTARPEPYYHPPTTRVLHECTAVPTTHLEELLCEDDDPLDDALIVGGHDKLAAPRLRVDLELAGDVGLWGDDTCRGVVRC